ncbi:MAG: hypothetical protein ACRDRK_20165 [Pseudonocardia sp.]
MMPTLVVSILALILAVISLCWQAWSWFRTGPVVRLKTGWAVGVGGLSGRWIHITAHNTGRSPVQVTGYSLETPTGMSLVAPIPVPGTAQVPHTLDAGSQATFYLDADDVEHRCAQGGYELKLLQARVTLGNGKAVIARPGIGSVR